MRFVVSPLVVLVFAAGVFGCGKDDKTNTSGWRPLTDIPLTKREDALGIWTGERTLLLGGSNARPCPAGADCVTPKIPPLSDGAMFNPENQTWSSVSSAPVGFSSAEGLAVDGIAYVWTLGENQRPGAPRAFLAYDLEEDRWTRLPQPPVKTYSSIVATNDRIVAFSLSDEGTERRDFSFDPTTGRWTRLPDDPLPPSYDRTMFWAGDRLVLLADTIGLRYDPSKPALPKAASFDPETRRWHRLPGPESLDQYATNIRWFNAEGLVINPAPGEAKGPFDKWDRSYRDGGIFDPETEEWLDLPQAPDGVKEFAGGYGAGIAAGGESHYFGYEGWVLNAGNMSWIRVPTLGKPGDSTGGRTVVAAEQEMIVFGGVRFNADGSGRLLDEAWAWTPQ